MGNRRNTGSIGSAGCGCFLWIGVFVCWGFLMVIFPKLPDYEETMAQGRVVPGKVLRIETVENVTINDRHPRRVVFRYGEEQEGYMTLA
ncbi:MAG: hypothetical protein HKO57_13220, partial [Akkermansiaceae bacterium]|nr:hypothetical protein [Akkermansiaceae bacterium]